MRGAARRGMHDRLNVCSGHSESKSGCPCRCVSSNGTGSTPPSGREFCTNRRAPCPLICRREPEFSSGSDGLHRSLKGSGSVCVRKESLSSMQRTCNSGVIRHSRRVRASRRTACESASAQSAGDRHQTAGLRWQSESPPVLHRCDGAALAPVRDRQAATAERCSLHEA